MQKVKKIVDSVQFLQFETSKMIYDTICETPAEFNIKYTK